jgi:predicted HicB family RNase H-like nuclease
MPTEILSKPTKLPDIEFLFCISEKVFLGGRVPTKVRRSLAIQASESGVSLNRIAGAKLSR